VCDVRFLACLRTAQSGCGRGDSFWRAAVRTRKGSVALTGGEPLLYPRLFELMEVFQANTATWY